MTAFTSCRARCDQPVVFPSGGRQWVGSHTSRDLPVLCRSPRGPARPDQHMAVSEYGSTELLVLLILPTLNESAQVLGAVSSHSLELRRF